MTIHQRRDKQMIKQTLFRIHHTNKIRNSLIQTNTLLLKDCAMMKMYSAMLIIQYVAKNQSDKRTLLSQQTQQLTHSLLQHSIKNPAGMSILKQNQIQRRKIAYPSNQKALIKYQCGMLSRNKNVPLSLTYTRSIPSYISKVIQSTSLTIELIQVKSFKTNTLIAILNYHCKTMLAYQILVLSSQSLITICTQNKLLRKS